MFGGAGYGGQLQSGRILIRDYNKLSQEHKEKVWKYIKNLIRLQKAEKEVADKLYELKGSPKTQTEEYTTGEIFVIFVESHKMRLTV